jgi:carbohydrate kinase (thermoresistant glucokinase family)
MARALVVMGVSGSGKSTLGRALAARLGWPFIEGDTLHPPANVAKMAAGKPLDDADRRPFLEAVAQAIVAARSRAPAAGVIVSCSALKRSYRDLIRARAGAVTFVWPAMSRMQLAARLALRQDHFMPATLLDSQLADLEPPGADELLIRIDGDASTEAQVAAVLAALS